MFRATSRCCLGIALAGCALIAGSVRADDVLFDFDRDFDFAKVEARDVKVSESKAAAGSALRIASGHRQDWPGITLPAPKGRWDLSKFEYLELDVRNLGTNAVTVCCRVDNPGADGVRNCNTERIDLKGGESGVLKVVFTRKPPRSDVKLFGMRGYPIDQQDERAIDPANVTHLLVFVPKPSEDHVFEIDTLRAGGTYQPPKDALLDPKAFFPFIDTFGQYIHKDWPGKTHSLDELVGRVEAEAKELAAKPGPSGWNRYGGWQDGPALEATGFFRVAKHDAKWWLVDPEGRLFFSHGIDCVNTYGATPIDDRKDWFHDFPGDRAEFAGFFSRHGRVVRGYYKDKPPRCFDFAKANLLRKYGDDWQRTFADVSHRRLRSWGLNTIANWSDADIYLLRRTAYTVAVYFGSKPIQGSSGYWGQFKDPFEREFDANLRRSMAAQVGTSAGDPWCIGYFVDNEISWGDEVSLAIAALASPPDQAAKKVFVDDLKAKYGAIEQLNAAWGTTHASWDALLEHRGAPDKKKAWDDLTAFYTKAAERYFQTCRDAVKAVAPNNLYLGCRFAWVNPRAARAAAKYCDVVSHNLYRRSVATFQFPGGADVPLIIGEFHFGALDRGMFHTGLVRVATQDERAAAYKDYVGGVLRHPSFVGCHWFKYSDEPATGRPLDEENYQIGFVDIADTPYPETIEASREVGYGMYEYRLKAK